MNSTAKVFLACALGAFVGALVALEVKLNLWLGMPLGALVAYLSYEFEAVIRAIPAAWHAVTSWWPDREFWHDWRRGFLYGSVWVTSFSFPMSLLIIWGVQLELG